MFSVPAFIKRVGSIYGEGVIDDVDGRPAGIRIRCDLSRLHQKGLLANAMAATTMNKIFILVIGMKLMAGIPASDAHGLRPFHGKHYPLIRGGESLLN